MYLSAALASSGDTSACFWQGELNIFASIASLWCVNIAPNLLPKKTFVNLMVHIFIKENVKMIAYV